MPSRGCDRCQNLQTTIDHLALELANERAEHSRTIERLERAERRARRYRWVAEQIHNAALGGGKTENQEQP